jgi:hypothetical protein
MGRQGGGNGYLRTVGDYVHLNPVRARLVLPEAPLESFRWSSHGEYLKPAGLRSKVMLARRLRQETTMSLKWIAARLLMSTWTYVSNLLNEPPETRPQAQEVLPLRQ